MMQRHTIELLKRIRQLPSRRRQARIQGHPPQLPVQRPLARPDLERARRARPSSSFAVPVDTAALLDVAEIDRVDGAPLVGDHGRFHVAQERPLGVAEERVGFDVRGAGAGADAAEFVFDEQFADEGFAEAGLEVSGQAVYEERNENEVKSEEREYTLKSAVPRFVRGRALHPSRCWRTLRCGSCP